MKCHHRNQGCYLCSAEIDELRRDKINLMCKIADMQKTIRGLASKWTARGDVFRGTQYHKTCNEHCRELLDELKNG